MTTPSHFVKTPKGIEEINQRGHGLAQRGRRVLIMLDGKRDLASLAATFPTEDVAAILDSLLADGFIVPLAEAAPASNTPPPPDDAKRFEMAHNFMINTVGEFLGVMGSGLIEKLERCGTLEELRGHYAAWREAIQLSRDGRKQAAELESRLAALLS